MESFTKSLIGLLMITSAQAQTMEHRGYTVQEIDSLRTVVENKYVWGRYSGPVFSSGSTGVVGRAYYPNEKEKVVEEQVRTWMLAGKTAQDLLDSEK